MWKTLPLTANILKPRLNRRHTLLYNTTLLLNPKNEYSKRIRDYFLLACVYIIPQLTGNNLKPTNSCSWIVQFTSMLTDTFSPVLLTGSLKNMAVVMIFQENSVTHSDEYKMDILNLEASLQLSLTKCCQYICQHVESTQYRTHQTLSVTTSKHNDGAKNYSSSWCTVNAIFGDIFFK